MRVKMKRFIVLGLLLGMLSGCATVGVMGKTPEAVTAEEKADILWEWWETLSTILSLLPKGW